MLNYKAEKIIICHVLCLSTYLEIKGMTFDQVHDRSWYTIGCKEHLCKVWWKSIHRQLNYRTEGQRQTTPGESDPYNVCATMFHWWHKSDQFRNLINYPRTDGSSRNLQSANLSVYLYISVSNSLILIVSRLQYPCKRWYAYNHQDMILNAQYYTKRGSHHVSMLRTGGNFDENVACSIFDRRVWQTWQQTKWFPSFYFFVAGI